ncbi:MAG TPA: cobalamin-binding protein, partial [Anaerolineae bacterium]|nr:cobalamin-binding protein [Anaerolineae bacterium]
MFHKSQSVLIALAVLLATCGPTVTPTLIPTSAPTSVPTIVPTAVPTALPTPAPIALTDGLGHSVTLNAIPRRIVSIAPSNTEFLFAVGAGDQVVGR